MDLNDLSVLVEAVRAGSLSEVARRTGVPLATVSRRVRRLEATLSLRLLERGRRGIRATAAGERLVERAGPGLDLMREAEREPRNVTGVTGWLRVSLPPTCEPAWRLLAEFRHAHPGVTIDVFTSERRVDLVADGIDVALRIGAVGQADYVGRRLTSYRHVLVASPAFLRTHRVVRVDDVLQVPCGAFRSGPEHAVSWTLGERSLRPAVVLLANDYAHLRARALAGEVLTELPPFLASEAVEAGALVRVLRGAPLPETTVTAVFPERRHLPALVRTFVDVCVERAPSLLAPVWTDGAGRPAPRRRPKGSSS